MAPAGARSPREMPGHRGGVLATADEARKRHTMEPLKPVYGKVELENGLVLAWLRFVVSEEEAVRIVIAQHVHVARCWVVPAP